MRFPYQSRPMYGEGSQQLVIVRRPLAGVPVYPRALSLLLGPVGGEVVPLQPQIQPTFMRPFGSITEVRSCGARASLCPALHSLVPLCPDHNHLGALKARLHNSFCQCPQHKKATVRRPGGHFLKKCKRICCLCSCILLNTKQKSFFCCCCWGGGEVDMHTFLMAPWYMS